VPAGDLAKIYGEGAHATRTASAALEQAKELAGPAGNVLVCGSLYLVGEILGANQTTRL
jgi:folylpolyglutamate synthase/dihydropteroate synthase